MGRRRALDVAKNHLTRLRRPRTEGVPRIGLALGGGFARGIAHAGILKAFERHGIPIDSTGATIDFLLSAHRDAAAAKRLFQSALRATGHPRPRVINVDGNPSYPKVVAELKAEGKLGRRCRCRTCPYLNNIVEQDHRAIKRRVNASQGFRSFHGARRTIQGYEVVHMIRKGQVRWLPKGDVAGLILFINETLGIEG